MTGMGTAPSLGPANPLVLGVEEKARPDIPFKFQVPIKSKGQH